MAMIEVFPDSPSVGISPRISFSHDLPPQNDKVPVEQYIRSTSPSSSIDFDFCVFRESFDHESSSADELFFDGKILPIEIKRRLAPAGKPPQSPSPSRPPLPPPKVVHDVVAVVEKGTEIEEKQNCKSTSSFWRFKRSSSLNCGSGYGGGLCPLPLLSRSNSTGSTASGGKRSSNSNSQKQNLLRKSKSSSSSSSTSTTSHQKPPLKKSSYNYNGVKISPILNVPSANLFGLGSLFSSGKDKTRKKS